VPYTTTSRAGGSLFDWHISHESSPEYASAFLICPLANLDSAERANGWLADLHEWVVAPVICSRQADDERIRVAVLDTGLDEKHPEFEKSCKSNESVVKCCRDWTKTSSDPDATVDSILDGTMNDTQLDHVVDDHVGHGTAVCDILTRVAKIELYVGKVSNTAKFSAETPEAVAKVSFANMRHIRVIITKYRRSLTQQEFGKSTSLYCRWASTTSTRIYAE
jgi:hypothetical protein